MKINAFISEYKAWFQPVIGFAVFVLALFACHHVLKEINPEAVRQAIRNVPVFSIVGAFVAAVLSFLMLYGYEWSADKYSNGNLSRKALALGSFCAFAVSNAVGLAVFSGGTVRYRLYKPLGTSPLTIAKISLFASFSFNVVVPLLIAFLVLFNPHRVASLFHLPPLFLSTVALLLIVFYGGLVFFCYSRRLPRKTPHTRLVQLGSYRLEIPDASLSLMQFLITTLDVVAAGTVLYLLLPHQPPFASFLPVYFVALAAGAISNAPGGLGAFEAILLTAFSSTIGIAELTAALVLYRLIYTIIPFLAACTILLVREFLRIRQVRSVRFHSTLAPPIMGLAVFSSGILLIVSGSTPEIYNRLKYLGVFLPTPLIDSFHLLAGIIGVLCLLLARGLWQRLSGAWLLTFCLLMSGAFLSLLKGFDWEEAVVLFFVAGLLFLFKPSFHRKSRLTQLTFSPHYLTVVALVLGLSLWISFFSYRNVGYSGELWWQFGLDANASRSLRAFLGCSVVVMLFGIRWLLNSVFTPVYPTDEELDVAVSLYRRSENPDTALCLSGDKMLLFNDDRSSMVMYGRHGRSLVALYDPIGPPEKQEEMIWRFKEFCDLHLYRPVFYQVAAKNLPMYVDLGMTAIKIGEEAIIDLTHFSLQSREMRRALHQGERDDCVLEIHDAGKMPIETLKPLSDHWLKSKNVREKGFSLGRFDADYLNWFRMATIRRGKEIVAFANIFETETGGVKSASIDLMRYGPEAPKSVMFFLIVSLLCHFQKQGYHRFSLGMAPLSGLVIHASSPISQKITSFFYRKGGYFYNFQGLRLFKEKFHPRWESRYVVVPRYGNTLLALADASVLIAGGITGLIKK